MSYRYGKQGTKPEKSSTEFTRQLLRERQVNRRRAVDDTVEALRVTIEDLRETINGLYEAADMAGHELNAIEGLVYDLEQAV